MLSRKAREEAVEVILGHHLGSRCQVVEAWEELVNSGDVWLMDRWFTETAAAMIEGGLLVPEGRME